MECSDRNTRGSLELATCVAIDIYQMVSFRYLIPNVLTSFALCCGVTAIYFSMKGDFESAIWCIVLAAMLDLVDGRVARWLHAASHFGAELDSLADFANFGVAPVFIIYSWSLHEFDWLGWVAVLVFVISSALRIARHNIVFGDITKPGRSHHFFTGVPTPAGAIVVLLPAYLSLLGLIDISHGWSAIVFVHIVFVSILMVSRLPTFTGKQIAFRSRVGVAIPLVAAILALIMISSLPWLCLSALSIVYLGSLPFSFRAYRRRLDT